jgi:hypothetical protein
MTEDPGDYRVVHGKVLVSDGAVFWCGDNGDMHAITDPDEVAEIMARLEGIEPS